MRNDASEHCTFRTHSLPNNLTAPFAIYHLRLVKMRQEGVEHDSRYWTAHMRKTYEATREDFASGNVDESRSTFPQRLAPTT